uniref:Ras-related protein Rab-44 n=1 Tax=Amazona collaria TaxID=241587 RepID=A0A8B9GEX3_9PSIT
MSWPSPFSAFSRVWEMLLAEISLLGAPQGVSSVEEDPFPEPLKEERPSEQSSLLREMNDAIAALSKQLRPQAPGAPPAPANTAHHPHDDAEPQMRLEEATAHGTPPRVLQETLSGHIGHKLFEGDMEEGPGTAPDVTQAGASTGAGHHRAQEPEQGEEEQRTLFLQGKGGGVKEAMVKVEEHLQGALEENTEAGEQMLREVEGAGWMQEKANWEKAQLLGEAEEVALSQGENLEAGLGSPEAMEAGLGVQQCLGMDEFHPAAAQPLGTGLGDEAQPPLGLSKELEIRPGELPEPEPPSRGKARIGAAQGRSVLPEVTVAPGTGMLEEDRVSAEAKLQGEALDAEVLPAQAQHGAGVEEREVEVTQGESARGDAEQGGSIGAEVPVPAVLPPEDVQEGGAGTDVPPLEEQSSRANVQLLAEVEAALQPWVEAGSLGTKQVGRVAPDVQPLEEGHQPELGLGEDMGAAVVQGEGPSPAEMSLGSPDLCVLFPVKAQALEMVEAQDSWADMQLHRGSSPETPQGEEGHTVVHLLEEDEDGAQERGEHGLPQEPVLGPQGAGFGQGEGAAAGVQPQEEAESPDRLEDQSTCASVWMLAEMDEVKVTPGWNTEDLQLLSEVSSLGTEQRGNVAPGVQPLDQVDKAELVALEAEDAQADMEPHGGLSPEAPWGAGGGTAVQREEKDEDGAQEQGERGVPQEPVLDPQGAGFGHGEVAAAGLKPWEEAESLDRLEYQNIGANVQALAVVEKLKVTPGGSTDTDLQLLSEDSSLDTEQGGSVAPDVQPLDQVDKAELVEMGAEDSTANVELQWGPSIETLQGGEHHAGLQLVEEDEDGEEGQSECGLPHEPVLHPSGVAIRQGGGAAAGVQPWEEAESLDRLEDQSTDASVRTSAEMDEVKVTPGGSTGTDLQLLSEVSSPGTEQRGSVAPDVPDVQTLDQVDKAELVEMKAEDWADMELHRGPSPETPQGEGGHAALHHMEEDDNGAQEQGKSGLPQEPVLHPHRVRQREGAGTGVQPHAEAVILDTLEAQSPAASVQPLAEVDELKPTPEADLQLPREVSSLDTEQGGGVAPDVQPLDQVDKAELVEMEAEDWADMELHGGPSPETPQGGGGHAAMQLVEEDENGEEGQGEHGLQQESVLDPQGAGFGQGEGAATGVHAQDKAVILGRLEAQSTDMGVQPLTEPEELRSSSGGSTEANVGAAGMQEGKQSHTAGSDVAHTAEGCKGAAGAHVPPPAEAISYPEHDAAPKAPGVGAKLGALTGLDGQNPEDTQTLELPQGERAAAEGRPLDGAQGLAMGQGLKLEAGGRSSVETQGLGLKQGHDDGTCAPAFPVSEVPLQISTLKLEAVMQEDVLVPDVRLLGASGQAAQSELQKQVSAQAEKLPHEMETGKAAAGPAELPKQEVAPASPLHTRVLQQEDSGNDQLGMVLGGSSLGDAASTQPQRQFLGEQSKDLDVDRWKRKQEVGRKMSQEGEPSPGEPETVSADGAGAAPRGSAKAPLDPDHLYNVLFVGDSHVGKTSFLYRLHADTFNPHLTATVGLDYQVKNFVVDNKCFALRLWDSAGQERYHSITKQFFRKADGVVLMYDITSEYSFLDVQYWLSCIQEGAEDGVSILLLGNKTDCAAERQVPMEQGERLAKEHQLMFYECSAASGHNISESMVSLIRLLKANEDKLKNKAEEVLKLPQKKKSCCW